jgi:non-ribosomal peptide synthetase component F
VTACYAARVRGAAAVLPELSVQYPDYALWERRYLTEQRVAAEQDWWRQYLAGAPNSTELPADRPRPALRSFDGARMPFRLPEPVAARLERLAAEHDATAHMVLMAALTVLLQRYTGQRSLVVGTMTAGRTDVATEPLIGYLVNAVAVRTDLSGEMSFAQHLDRVRETTLRAYAHQELPFDLVVDAAGRRPEPGRSPLFQIALLVQNTPEPTADPAAGFSLERIELDPGTSKCDLSVVADTGPGTLSGHIEYNTGLFRPETVARFVEHLTTLLAAGSASPDTAVADLPLMSDENRARVLALGAAVTAPAEPAEPAESLLTLPDLVRRRTMQRPAAVAVSAGDDALTYADLDHRGGRVRPVG